MTFLIIILIYLTFCYFTVFNKLQYSHTSPEEYFLSNRNIGQLSLFFTLIATNYSAFFFLGFAGEAYRNGITYYTMMSLGTSYAAISFYLVGNKAWVIAKKLNIFTPTELIRKLSKNGFLTNTYLIVMCLCLIPFLTIQLIGAGLILQNISQGTIPYPLGVTCMAAFIVCYLVFGGMKSLVSMDIKNAVIILIMMVIAFVFVIRGTGGFEKVNNLLLLDYPELLSARGNNDYYSPLRWCSYIILWITCLPMLPQIFTRFMISKDIQTLKMVSVYYTIVPPIFFLMPVFIGAAGKLSFPDLASVDSDQILLLMLDKYTTATLMSLVLLGAISAMISTTDSLLLSLATIFTRDIYARYLNPDATPGTQILVGKLIIITLATIAIIVALFKPESIFKIATLTFSGIAILFPVTMIYLYSKKINPYIAAIAIILGETILISLEIGWLNNDLFSDVLPVIPALGLCSLVLLFGIFYESNQNVKNAFEKAN